LTVHHNANPGSDSLFRELLESAPDAMIIANRDGVIELVNAQAERLFGYPRVELIGNSVDILVPERLKARHIAKRTTYFERSSHPPMTAGLEVFGTRRDGTEVAIELMLSPLHNGNTLLVCAAIRDITVRRRTEALASHFAAIVESSSDAIIGQAYDASIVSWNGGAEALYGYRAEDVIGQHISILLPPNPEENLEAVLERVRAGEHFTSYETVRRCKDGRLVNVALTISPIRNSHSEIVGISNIARNIDDLVSYRDELRRTAELDFLTGAHNRRRFEQDLRAQIDRAHRYGEHGALLVVDIDHFKDINDEYGHRVGDRVLQSFALGVRQRLRASDILGRIGGDEFAILLPHTDLDQAGVVAEEIGSNAGRDTISVGERQMSIRASVGVAVITAETPDVVAAFVAADEAMYEDKRRGRTGRSNDADPPDAPE